MISVQSYSDDKVKLTPFKWILTQFCSEMYEILQLFLLARLGQINKNAWKKVYIGVIQETY